MALLWAALLALAQDSSKQCGTDSDEGLGWRENTTHPTTVCNMPVVDAGAGGLSLVALAERLASATTPLLVRGLLDAGTGHRGWRAQASAFGNRSALLERFGDVRVRLSVGTLLSNGPESTALDAKKLAFMRKAWKEAPGGGAGGEGSGGFVDTVAAQVRAGEARPEVALGAWLTALRNGSAPPDAYVFHKVSGPTGSARVAAALAPLRALWRGAVLAQFARRRELETEPESELESNRKSEANSKSGSGSGSEPGIGSPSPSAPPFPPLTRLGVGGAGSGAPFHDHEVLALNVALAGRKRWLVTPPCNPHCRIPFYRGGAAVYHPLRLLAEPGLPAQALAALTAGGGSGEGGGGQGGDGQGRQSGSQGGQGGGGEEAGAPTPTWDCVQRAGEVVLIPEGFLHATVNLDGESVAVATQCDDGADGRAGLTSALNAMVVVASGAAGGFGACGAAWAPPAALVRGGVVAANRDGGGDAAGDVGRALAVLEALPDHFRGDPAVFLNRPVREGGDGHVPADVVARFGSVAVAAALARHGARFSPAHREVAARHGHAALAAFIGRTLEADRGGASED